MTRGPRGSREKQGPRRASTPAFFSPLDQVLRDLDGVGRRALANLVAAAPERERAHALGRGEVATDAADVDEVLVGGLERHGIAARGGVVHDLHARRRLERGAAAAVRFPRSSPPRLPPPRSPAAGGSGRSPPSPRRSTTSPPCRPMPSLSCGH